MPATSTLQYCAAIWLITPSLSSLCHVQVRSYFHLKIKILQKLNIPTCKNHTTKIFFLDFPANVSYVHIRNATLDYINATEVRWRMLKSLAITDGKIHSMKGQFLMMTPILCLNLSNNALLEMENNSLIRLSQLTTLDLSYNNLTHLPALNVMNGREFWLDICGK